MHKWLCILSQQNLPCEKGKSNAIKKKKKKIPECKTGVGVGDILENGFQLSSFCATEIEHVPLTITKQPFPRLLFCDYIKHKSIILQTTITKSTITFLSLLHYTPTWIHKNSESSWDQLFTSDYSCTIYLHLMCTKNFVIFFFTIIHLIQGPKATQVRENVVAVRKYWEGARGVYYEAM